MNKGVLLLCFDVPSVSKGELRKYRAMKKELKKTGFISMQESVYVKLLRNFKTAQSEIVKLNAALPKDGNMFIIPMRLQDFSRITYLRGDSLDLSLLADDIVSV